ncbi:MAG: hypothetical protein IT580_12140 [Verrucomicrobiales bacterium]|nr:hypothetical protein [Verrucomicrobiales bacterium]
MTSPTAAIPARDLDSSWLRHPIVLTAWCMVAAFGTYACMYGFRKPFTAAPFATEPFGDGFKTLLVTSQVLGYTVSKFLGIRIIAAMPAARRVVTLLGLIGGAQLALVLFAILPRPLNIACLFLNGLPLGMVFGLVLGFLEGRRMTEAFVAGLCTSFILADGFAKSVGAWLLASGIPERWMPATAGMLFLAPLLAFVFMLQHIPPPTRADISARSERLPMSREDRLRWIRRHGLGLLFIATAYLLLTVIRSLRADFAPEIWAAFGTQGQPGIFTRSELWVAAGVMLANGSLVCVQDNRKAFFLSLAISITGLLLALVAVLLLRRAFISPFGFMVLLGLGLYLPYVAVHTTVFERLIALTRDRGNIGYLMYLADSAGYLGYAAVMLGRDWIRPSGGFLDFFLQATNLGATLAMAAFAAAAWQFRPWRAAAVASSEGG